MKVAKYLTGYSSAGKATADFNSSFKKHVIAWQQSHGLVGDGVIGADTWTVIAKNAPAVKKENKTAVYAFQTSTGLTANGSYNTATKNLIMNYQKASGLLVNGVCDANTWVQVIALKPVAYKHTTNYKQNDARWKDVIYSKTGKKTGQTIGNSGCAPTSFASIVSMKDHNITPADMCALAVKTGDRRNSGGTDGAFFTHAGDIYGYTVIETMNVALFKHCLDSGGYPVCAFKAGSWWTSCGHYSPAWKYDSKFFYVDNTISKLKIKRDINRLKGDCRAFYLIYPKGK